MKKSSLRKLIREVIKEQGGDLGGTFTYINPTPFKASPLGEYCYACDENGDVITVEANPDNFFYPNEFPYGFGSHNAISEFVIGDLFCGNAGNQTFYTSYATLVYMTGPCSMSQPMPPQSDKYPSKK